MKLILITNSDTSPNETAIVTALFEHGLETLHLRKPEMSTKELSNYIKAIPSHFHPRIVIHTHHQLVFRFTIGGIHLLRIHRQSKLSNWIRLRWIKLRRPTISISSSYQKLAQLYSDQNNYSYVLLGPVYDRHSQKLTSGFNRVNLVTVIRKKNIPIIARGGITPENIGELRDIGFSGIALQSSFWRSQDPLQDFLTISELLHTADKKEK